MKKSSAKKSSPTKKKPAKRNNSKRKAATARSQRSLLSWFGSAVLIILVGVLIWVVYLDVQVRSKFDGRKWQLPAQVYSRPLALYRGAGLRPEDLQRQLQVLNFNPVDNVESPGQYRRRGDQFDIFTRGFAMADEVEVSRRVRLRISHQRVARLQIIGTESSPAIVRLAPARIGGIYPRLQQDRELVQLSEIPPLLGEALIAVEDHRFIDHHGVSLRDIARAAVSNIRAGRVVQGGSTLTQQLVKNFYLDSGRRWSRKLTEAVMALLLEWHYSKAEILETYINEVYLGQSGPRQIHGFALASKHYFQKPLHQLKTHQIALLVGLVKGASYYNPWRHPERARDRRDLVIGVLEKQGLIGAGEAQASKAAPLGVVDQSRRRLHDFPAFIDLVKRQLLQEYSADQLSSDGLSIYSNLSLPAQWAAEEALAGQLDSLAQRHQGTMQQVQGAVVVASVATGEVEAVVGDRNVSFAGFNRALDARRSIGSLIKPAVYLAALNQGGGYHLASMVADDPVTVQGPDGSLWRPQNFDRRSHGEVQLYDALLNSYNLATARLGMTVGLDRVEATIRDLGVTAHIPQVPSLLLGALELSPIEVTAMYQGLANGGVVMPLRSIRSVVDAQGQLLSRYRMTPQSDLDPASVGLVQFALQGVAREGTGRGLYQSLPGSLGVAAKTGTSNDQRDSWFAGFTAEHVAVSWVGLDDNGETPLSGATGALPVWRALFSQLPTRGLALPEEQGIEYRWVDAENGGISGENCRNSRLLPFAGDRYPDYQSPCQWRQNPLLHWMQKWF
ncbi:MAG: penicillin-binding protein 1B [Candidatus Pelagadaptatus aseana]|uniref:penicillin-binding protein 1B n=1 Tax=Candidatus Pelagadaptatus aseana TaxID=3120508 RepID=UPI0039B1B71D